MKDVAIVFTAIKLRDYSTGRAIWINVNQITSIKETSDNHALVICGRQAYDVQEPVEEIMDFIGGMYGEDEDA